MKQQVENGDRPPTKTSGNQETAEKCFQMSKGENDFQPRFPGAAKLLSIEGERRLKTRSKTNNRKSSPEPFLRKPS